MEISDERILAAMNVADDNTKKVLTALFGQEKPSIMDRIKTFEDACNELDEYHPYVVAWQRYKQADSLLYSLIKSDDIEAYLQLRIIAAALNEGWEPQFTSDEHRYYPRWALYNKNNIDVMDRDRRAPLYFFGMGSSGETFAIECTGCYEYFSTSCPKFSATLMVKSQELAKYFGKQFIDTWVKYITM